MSKNPEEERKDVQARLNKLRETGTDEKFNSFLDSYNITVDLLLIKDAEEYATLAEIFSKSPASPFMSDNEKDKYFEQVLSVQWNELSSEVTSAIRWKRYPCQSVLPSETMDSQIQNEVIYGMSGQELDDEFSSAPTIKR